MLATLTVDVLTDEVAADGMISLREAIDAANLDTVADDLRPNERGSGSDVIRFNDALFTDGPRRVELSGSGLRITSDISLDGPGADLLVLDASPLDPTPATDNSDGSRVLLVLGEQESPITVSITGVALTGGDSPLEMGSSYIYPPGGGGLHAEYADVTLRELLVTDNSARTTGFGISAVNSTMRILDSQIIGNGLNRDIGVIRPPAAVSLTLGEYEIARTLIDDNGGAGVYVAEADLLLEESRITRNERGGLDLTQSDVVVRSSAIEGNLSKGPGVSVSYGTLTLIDSSITDSGNRFPGVNLAGSDIGLEARNSTAILRNSTIARNRVGILASHQSHIELEQSTVAFNRAYNRDAAAGIEVVDDGSSVRLTHSILANNYRDSPIYGLRLDIAGEITAIDSLIGDAGSATILGGGSLIGVDARLGDPGYYGGSTVTVPLLEGSPAIDAGPEVAGALTDQRGGGFLRGFDGDGDSTVRIDLGAYERQIGAQPVEFVVDTLRDEFDWDYSPGDLSLREAISLASANDTSGETPGRVGFARSLDGGTFQQLLGTIPVRSNVTIDARDLLNGVTLDGGVEGDDDLASYLSTATMLSIPERFFGGSARVALGGVTLTGAKRAIEYNGYLTLNDTRIVDNYGSAITGTGSSFGGRSEIGLHVVDSTIARNRAQIVNGVATGGDAILVRWGDFTLLDSVVADNDFANGGTVFVDGAGVTLIEGNTIRNNRAYRGGGVRIERSQTTVRESLIVGNEAILDGGGVFVFGTGSTVIERSTLLGNTAGGDGGGVNVQGSDLILRDSTIAHNQANDLGGGVYSHSLCSSGDTTLSFIGSTISNNGSSAGAGGVYLQSSDGGGVQCG